MFHHIMDGAKDVEASRKFYDAAPGVLGHGPGDSDPKDRVFYITPTGNKLCAVHFPPRN